MEEKGEINKFDKTTKYSSVIDNLNSLYEYYDSDVKLSFLAKMASISSAIKKEFDEFTFVGFYVVTCKENGEKFLEVGPYVSDILATPRIAFGKGVCGSTWENKVTMIVNNVKKCNNYIACSLNVMSEIVVPVFNKNDEVIAILDIDCKVLDRFDDYDKEKLEYITSNFC